MLRSSPALLNMSTPVRIKQVRGCESQPTCLLGSKTDIVATTLGLRCASGTMSCEHSRVNP